MKKAGRKLFQALGELRDMQVMREWIERLNDRKSFSRSPGDVLSGDHVSGDPVAINRSITCTLAKLNPSSLHSKISISLIASSGAAVDEGPAAAPAGASEGMVHLHLALEKWTAAHRHGRSSRARRQQPDEQVPYCLRLVLSNFADQSVRTLESPRSLHFHFPVVICTRPDN